MKYSTIYFIHPIRRRKIRRIQRCDCFSNPSKMGQNGTDIARKLTLRI